MPENWYRLKKEKLVSAKVSFFDLIEMLQTTIQGAAGVLRHHEECIPKALVELFPNIGLEEAKFYDC